MIKYLNVLDSGKVISKKGIFVLKLPMYIDDVSKALDNQNPNLRSKVLNKNNQNIIVKDS